MSGTEPETHVLAGFPDVALRFFRMMEQARRRVASEHDLSEIELRAMFRVGAEGTITPKKLAADLSMTKGAITGVTSRLVDAGFVSRGEHPHDRRSLHLELTGSGHEAMRAVHHEFRAMFSTTGTGITDSDLLVASSVLEQLSARAVESTTDRP